MKTSKAKVTKAQEQLIRQATEQAFRGETEALLRNDSEQPLHPDFEQRLFTRVDAALNTTRPHRMRVTLRCLVAVIVLLTLLVCGTAVACPVIRQRIVRLNKKEDPAHGNTHYTPTVEGQERRAFDLVEYYTLTDIPADFTPYASHESPRCVNRIWIKSGSETCISFLQIPLNALCILSTEECTEETVILHGHEVTYYHKPGSKWLVWTTDDCMYVISYWGPDTQGLDIFALEASMTLCGTP